LVSTHIYNFGAIARPIICEIPSSFSASVPATVYCSSSGCLNQGKKTVIVQIPADNPLSHVSGHRYLRLDRILNEQKHPVKGLFLKEFRPKTMVAGHKNQKNENFFYFMPHKHLRRKCRLQFCRFSHQTRRSLQLWGTVFWAESKDGSSKYEYRNTKQYQNTKFRMLKTVLNFEFR
jgi:hypothetical protein